MSLHFFRHPCSYNLAEWEFLNRLENIPLATLTTGKLSMILGRYEIEEYEGSVSLNLVHDWDALFAIADALSIKIPMDRRGVGVLDRVELTHAELTELLGPWAERP